MSHISGNELMNTVDVFFVQLFGEENYMKWQELKIQLGFTSEQVFVTWMLNTATRNYNFDKIDSFNTKPSSSESNLSQHNTSTSNFMTTSLASSSKYAIEDLDYDVANIEDGVQSSELAPREHLQEENSVTELHDDTIEVKNEECDEEIELNETTDVDYESPDASVIENDSCEGNISENPDLTSMTNNVADIYNDDIGMVTELSYRPKCTICKKYFRHRGDLQRHHKEVHLNIRKHSCEHCGRQFSRSYILKKHVDTIHFYIRNFACEVCSKTFSAKANLIEHQRRYHNIDVA